MKCAALRWVIITPLGAPVDPDVNRMCAMSPSPLAYAGVVAGQASRSRIVNAGAGSASAGNSSSSHPIKGRCSSFAAASASRSIGPTGPAAKMQRQSLASSMRASRTPGPAGSSGT